MPYLSLRSSSRAVTLTLSTSWNLLYMKANVYISFLFWEDFFI